MPLFRKFISLFLVFALFTLVAVPLSAADGFSDVTFFGDSTTAHLALRGGIPRGRILTGANNTVLFETVNKQKCIRLCPEKKDLTLFEAVKLRRPKILVVTLGVSGGAGTMSRECFTAIYREMLSSIRRASPETRILVQSILPLSHHSVKHYKHLTKESVVEANGWIRSLCKEMNIPYLDTHKELADPATGYLRNEYQNDEYMHLTKAAYAVVLSHIRGELIRLGYL